jgi:protein TonB
MFDQPKKTRMGGALLGSIIFHAGLFALIFYIFIFHPEVAQQMKDEVVKVVYLPQQGPGGGGGGSPKPAPPKPTEIPKAKAPEPVVPPPVVPPPMPIPTLNAPVTTQAANIQAAGMSAVSLSAYGGGGRGTGIGSGTGNGVGPGTGGGFGGGAYRPGNGISSPTLLKQVRPNYTPDAMRAKIQGMATIEAVVKEDGTVSDVRIVKSFDKVYGLDQEALKAARQWLFRPAHDPSGKAVPVLITIELEFTLH